MRSKKQNTKKTSTRGNTALSDKAGSNSPDSRKAQTIGKSNPTESRFSDGALKNISDPTLAATARVNLSKSTAVDTMCRVIEHDQKLTTDEKLQRLQSVNETEKKNKEQAHRIATEFTWQDGLIAFCFGGLLFGLGWLGGSSHPRLPKSA